MPSPALRPRRPALATAGAAVLLLHLLAVLLLASLGTWRDRGPAQLETPPLTVWLLQPPSAARTPDARPKAVPARPTQTPLPRPQQPTEPAAITLPALPAEPAAQPAAEAPPGQPAAPPAAPLNLALPRGASAPWRQRNPALDDARAATARATFESRLAGALGGDGAWHEERVDKDRVRFRRGNTCVDVERSRAERLDGFNNSFSPKPWVAGKPASC